MYFQLQGNQYAWTEININIFLVWHLLSLEFILGHPDIAICKFGSKQMHLKYELLIWNGPGKIIVCLGVA